MDAKEGAANKPVPNIKTFSDLFHHYYTSLCFFAAGIAQDKASAESIVADVFETIWIDDKWLSIEKIGPYLYRSVLNGCINASQKEKTRAKHHVQATSFTTLEEDVILERIYKAEAFRELYNAIDQLPPQCKRIIDLSFREGMKISEVAQIMGISESTVKTQRMRGISILRKILSHRALTLAIAVAKFPL